MFERERERERKASKQASMSPLVMAAVAAEVISRALSLVTGSPPFLRCICSTFSIVPGSWAMSRTTARWTASVFSSA